MHTRTASWFISHAWILTAKCNGALYLSELHNIKKGWNYLHFNCIMRGFYNTVWKFCISWPLYINIMSTSLVINCTIWKTSGGTQLPLLRCWIGLTGPFVALYSNLDYVRTLLCTLYCKGGKSTTEASYHTYFKLALVLSKWRLVTW